MMKSNGLRALRLDMKRAFLSWKFAISILLGFLVCYFALLFCGQYRRDAVYEFIRLHDVGQVLLAYVAGVIPYAFCFYEDFKFGNIRSVIGRVSLSIYTVSKITAAFLSSICAFVLGKLLFVLVYGINHPVILPDTLVTVGSEFHLYVKLLEGENYLGYFFMSSLQRGLFCGILCQAVMLVSLIIPNKAVAFSIPMAIFYIVAFYINIKTGMASYFNLSLIFDGNRGLWQSDWLNFGYSVLVAFTIFFFLYYLSLRILRKKVYHE